MKAKAKAWVLRKLQRSYQERIREMDVLSVNDMWIYLTLEGICVLLCAGFTVWAGYDHAYATWGFAAAVTASMAWYWCLDVTILNSKRGKNDKCDK